ncbi:MAG: acetylpolyamine aminohydrolase [Pseudomonadota bacterium]
MLTFYNEQHTLHKGGIELARDKVLPWFERPERAEFVLAELQRRNLGPILNPQRVALGSLERIHSVRYLDFLRHAWQEWLALDPANAGKDALPSVWPIRTLRDDIEPINFNAKLGLFSMDNCSPLSSGTWLAAKAGADCAINAAHALQGEERGSFALTRPPGHHAGLDFSGGFCFLNNAALAAQHLLDNGCKRVAILDIDFHHGNGTQSIFYERADVLTLSIHGDPRTEFPFYLGFADETGSAAGLGSNLNIPLPAGSATSTWFAALETACLRIQTSRIEALVVALGVNSFIGDPVAGFQLQSADFLRVGERIGVLGLPTAFMFEGGYALNEIGVNVVNVLEGFETSL